MQGPLPEARYSSLFFFHPYLTFLAILNFYISFHFLELMVHESGCTGVRPPPGAAPRRVEQDFMTCEKCSAAFTLFDELQVHILTAHFEDSEKFTLFGGSGFPK